MAEYINPTHYLLTNFLKEGTGISREIRTRASGLSIDVSRFALQSPTIAPSQEDVSRIKRIHGIVHFASKNEYKGMTEKYMSEAEKKSKPIDPLLEAALNRESTYFTSENAHKSMGLTIFPAGSDRATAAIIRKPEEPTVSTELFLNILAEEMIHASSPQSTFLRTVQTLFPDLKMPPLDFFELVGRWIKLEFLEQYYPALILPEDQEVYVAKKEYANQGVDFALFKNLYLRGIYKAH